MKTLTQDQKMALLVVPVLLFGVLGANYASAAYTRNGLNNNEEEAVMEAHMLREAGDYEGAKRVLQEVGINRGPQNERGRAVRDAVEANDYAAFQVAIQNTPFADTMTQESFDVLVQAHALREAGDFEGAQTLFDGAHIQGPFHMGGHIGGRGHHWGMVENN